MVFIGTAGVPSDLRKGTTLVTSDDGFAGGAGAAIAGIENANNSNIVVTIELNMMITQ